MYELANRTCTEGAAGRALGEVEVTLQVPGDAGGWHHPGVGPSAGHPAAFQLRVVELAAGSEGAAPVQHVVPAILLPCTWQEWRFA